MMKSADSEYIFALSNPGSEKALKQEVEAMGLGWRSGYQRRGFTTFNAAQPFSIEVLRVNLACARRICLSLGKSTTCEEAVGRIEASQAFGENPVIHYARFHERQMLGVHGDFPSSRPQIGTIIGTVVELGATEFWAGLHWHASFLSPDPAGESGTVMPPESPSRAWLKLEEAVRFFDLKFSSKDIVVELGCSPGGVVLALLQRGVSVIGVDPAKMAPIVQSAAIPERRNPPAGRPWFYHCRKPAALVGKRDLGPEVTWFMSDMNQSPEVVIKECARFCRMAPGIRGALITLKTTDLRQIADKPLWFAALAEMGFTTLRLQQFSVHHREFALLAMK